MNGVRKSIINEGEWGVLSPEKKIHQVRLLLEDIYKLRALRREDSTLLNKLRVIKKEFSEALGLSDLKKMKSLLDSEENSRCINLNQQIDFCINDNHFQALPLIIAASIVVNVDMVRLFLEKGAIAYFPDGSLIKHMLVALNDDESLWFTKSCYRKHSSIARNRYLEILEYLLNYFEFDENIGEDSRQCVETWKLIMERVAEQNKFIDSESVRYFNVLTKRFFPAFD